MKFQTIGEAWLVELVVQSTRDPIDHNNRHHHNAETEIQQRRTYVYDEEEMKNVVENDEGI